MRVSIIAAVSENGVIGRDGKLPWHLSNDLRRFKQLTMGHTVIMGRRTWESIALPLPGRRMVVVSRRPEFRPDGLELTAVTSLDDAIQLAAAANDDEAFIIGGAELYRTALPIANRLYFTRVRAEVDGDTFFPDVCWEDWRLVESCSCAVDQKNDYAHTMEVYEPVE